MKQITRFYTAGQVLVFAERRNARDASQACRCY